MISVWAQILHTGTANFDAMQKAGFLTAKSKEGSPGCGIDFPYTFYDAFNPAARKALLVAVMNIRLFSKGSDAWWMDATEPDLTPSPPTLKAAARTVNPTGDGQGVAVMEWLRPDEQPGSL